MKPHYSNTNNPIDFPKSKNKMNKRILKLFNEAGFHQPEMERLGIEDKFEKFAELIVRECVDIIEKIPPGYKDYRDQIEDAFRIASIVEIKQRFGVK